MDAGRRPVSLRLLARIAELLDCSPADLIEIRERRATLFSNQHAMRQLQKRIMACPDGTERGWVHSTLLAWQGHYKRALPKK